MKDTLHRDFSLMGPISLESVSKSMEMLTYRKVPILTTFHRLFTAGFPTTHNDDKKQVDIIYRRINKVNRKLHGNGLFFLGGEI